VSIRSVLSPSSALPLHDSAGKALSAADYRQLGGNAKGKCLAGNRNQATRRHPSSRDAMPSPGSIEFGTVTGLIRERPESPRRRPCRPQLGYLRWQAEVSQDSLHHRRVYKSAPRGGAARDTADTPGRRTQTFAASAWPTDTHRPGRVRASGGVSAYRQSRSSRSRWPPRDDAGGAGRTSGAPSRSLPPSWYQVGRASRTPRPPRQSCRSG
jgi:hypothetical protein